MLGGGFFEEDEFGCRCEVAGCWVGIVDVGCEDPAYVADVGEQSVGVDPGGQTGDEERTIIFFRDIGASIGGQEVVAFVVV